MRYSDNVTLDLPRTIYLYATDFCNSGCSYCIFRMQNTKLPRVELPLFSIQKIWGQSNILMGKRLLTPPKVVLQGGEFTLHTHYLDIVNFFGSIGVERVLLTNVIVPERALELASLVEAVTVSYDGPKHDISRGSPGNRKSILDFLELAPVEKVSIQMTLGPWNCREEDIIEFLDIARKYNVKPRFNVASDNGLLGHGHYSELDLSKITNCIIQHGSDIVPAESLHYLLAIERKSYPKMCFSTSMYSTILADGRVLLCQGLDTNSAEIGNLYQDSFDSIWDKSTSIRRKYLTCRKCLLSCQLMGDLNFLREVK